MKKKNIILLSLVCILSLCIFSGLLVYAFQLQSRKDVPDHTSEEEQAYSDTNLAEDASPSASAVTPVATSDNEKSEDTATVTETPITKPATPEDTNQAVTEPIVLTFAGDINLDEASKPVSRYDSQNKGILGGISKELVEEMNAADLMMLNNEFSYSTRGAKTPNKSYTFRANPSRVSILGEMGVDIVSLANNHALDYGQDALADTFDTLENAGIDYVGAGENLDRAKAPVYKTVGDKTIAFVAASRVVFAMDWYATDTQPGMVGTYDPTIILESIKEAEANSDFVVVYVHWGVERNNYPEQFQRTLATQYIDAGADAVIGCHPHVMQGFEYYKGKPIAYSLGNYWFNSKNIESGLLKLYLGPDDTLKMQILPVMSKDIYTYLLTKEADKTNYFDFMEGLSYDVTIDKDGYVAEAE